MPGDQSHITNRLAQFVAGSQWETIPSEVRREGVRGLLNFVGCALGGARDEAMDIAIKVLAPFFGAPEAIVIGRGERPDTLHAAFLNAVSANVLEYDDTHLGTVMHPAAPVAPGLFAGLALTLAPSAGGVDAHHGVAVADARGSVGLFTQTGADGTFAMPTFALGRKLEGATMLAVRRGPAGGMAIATRINGARLATRNVTDFDTTGLGLVCPWDF